MPADIVTATRLAQRVRATVSTKSTFGDPGESWVLRPQLRVSNLTLRAYGYATCELSEPFGEAGLREPTETDVDGGPIAPDTLSAVSPADLIGQYVKVVVPMGYGSVDPALAIDPTTNPEAAVTWYGYITAEAKDRLAENAATSGVQRGDLRLRAVGLEWFLSRKQVDSAVVKDARSGAADFAGRRVQRPMTFNEEDPLATGVQEGSRGNKAAFVPAFRAAEPLFDAPLLRARASADVASVDGTIPIAAQSSDIRLPASWQGAPPAIPATVVNEIDGATGSIATPALWLLSGEPVPLKWDAGGGVWRLDYTAAVPWPADDMIEYLLLQHGPRDSVDDDAPCPYRIASGRSVLAHLTPEIPTDRRTVLELLNEICSRRRGVLWYAETVTTDEDASLEDPLAPGEFRAEVRIHVASLSPTAIPLPTGGTLPANGNQVSVDADGDVFASAIPLYLDEAEKYDEVTVRGARMTSTVTIGVNDGTLVPDWTKEDEDAYRDARSGDVDYPATTEEQKLVNDQFRSELRASGVFSRFRTPRDWDGLVGDGFGEPATNAAFYEINADGVIGSAIHVYPPAMRVLRETRLPLATVSERDAGFEPAFALLPLRSEDYDLEGPSQMNFFTATDWSLAHKYGDGAKKNERPAAYNLKRRERGIGVRLGSTKGLSHTLSGVNWTAAPSLYRLRDPGGTGSDYYLPAGSMMLTRVRETNGTLITDPEQHVWRWFRLSADWFSRLAVDLGTVITYVEDWVEPAPSRLRDEANWRRLRVTMTLEADRYAEASVSATTSPGQPRSRLIIDAGDHYRLDLLAPYAVTGVNKGASQANGATPLVLRNDQKELGDLAEMAFAWYRFPRRSMRLRLAKPYERITLGDMITTIGGDATADQVNTVVAEVRFGIGEASQSTTLVTVGAEAAPIAAALGGKPADPFSPDTAPNSRAPSLFGRRSGVAGQSRDHRHGTNDAVGG